MSRLHPDLVKRHRSIVYDSAWPKAGTVEDEQEALPQPASNTDDFDCDWPSYGYDDLIYGDDASIRQLEVTRVATE